MSISDAEEFFLQKILNDAAKKYSKSTIVKMRIVLKSACDRAEDIHFTMNTYTDANTAYLHEQVSVLEKKPRRKTMKFKLHHRQ